MKKTVFILILLLAAFLRFYLLGVNPPSLAWDEAALGYNAYSIGETGRDEFGRLLPYDYFASFGDYKPPLYVYAAVLPVKIFGLNEFAVRFPSAFFGTLTVFLTYLLVKEFFPKLKDSWLPEIAAFFLAISPWHTQLSRAAWEANLASFFVVLGVWLFLLSLRKQKWLLVLSAVSFAATFYTFNSTRIFSPLLVLGLLIWQRKKLWPIKKWILIAGLVAVLLTAPLVPHLLSPEGRLRFKEVNIFTDLGVIQTTNRWMAVDNNAFWSRIIHNRRIHFALLFLEHYFHHFEGKFLFISGDGNPKFSLQDVGELYLFDLPFFLAGVYFLIRKKEKAVLPLFWWLLAAPLPAATARETPHALRILDSLPTWQIITAYGFYLFIENLKTKKSFIRNYLLLAVGCWLFLNVFYYLHNYYAHYSTEFSSEWQYGYQEMVQAVSEIEANYDQVIVTKSLGRPYIYFLFYKKYPPEKFWQDQARVVKEPAGFINVTGFDKYEFRDLSWDQDQKEEKTLFVAIPQDVPQGVEVLRTVRRLNQEPVFVLFD
jgi:4-amino-4-deoxy-L-arabinose transferase-like glycosyltransferase